MSKQNQDQTPHRGSRSGSFTERIEVAADELVSTVKGLLEQGNVRRVTVRNKEGKKLFSVPLSAGIAVGGVAVMAAPTLAAIASIAALVTSVTVEVERTDVVHDATAVDADLASGGSSSDSGGTNGDEGGSAGQHHRDGDQPSVSEQLAD